MIGSAMKILRYLSVALVVLSSQADANSIQLVCDVKPMSSDGMPHTVEIEFSAEQPTTLTASNRLYPSIDTKNKGWTDKYLAPKFNATSIEFCHLWEANDDRGQRHIRCSKVDRRSGEYREFFTYYHQAGDIGKTKETFAGTCVSKADVKRKF